MSLQLVKSLLQLNPTLGGRITWDGWVNEQELRAVRVHKYRDYADGDHESKLTAEMAELLRVKYSEETSSPFNLNHLDTILSALVDRLYLTSVETDSDAGNEWTQTLFDENRIDAVQLSVHESACRDADTYLLCEYDPDEDRVKWTQEDAYDGVQGIVAVYGADRNQPVVVFKIWPERIADQALSGEERSGLIDTVRINAYYADRIEKYISRGTLRLERYEVDGEEWPAPWVGRDGKPLGVPIIHFRNRATKYTAYGKSELDDVIPAQDALNRTMTSMVMSAELSAFQVRYAIGIDPPAKLSPGAWIKAHPPKDSSGNIKQPTAEQLEHLKAIRFGTLEVGQIAPFIQEAEFLIAQMYEISRTPRGGDAGANASGEALRERMSGLVGKAKRAQISFGDSWERAVKVSAAIQAAYGKTQPPAIAKFYARWTTAELRNDAEVVDNILKIADLLDERTKLELLAPVYGWDTEKISSILQSRQGDAAARVATLAANLPGFGNNGL